MEESSEIPTICNTLIKAQKRIKFLLNLIDTLLLSLKIIKCAVDKVSTCNLCFLTFCYNFYVEILFFFCCTIFSLYHEIKRGKVFNLIYVQFLIEFTII